ncbi:hypothetical protein [Methylobacterium haplocladii]|uniref:Glycosyl transferase n=1 Tax=Methylobacterium haplocladii TaxID=1176176 RepID=A0A512IKB3_9HYPH|nr:hypothetical protein [Methylobacterium haplocladii]GEO98160.1 hypothetical protein MHA02_05480 [Methylobacterium haplocladii]GJD83593.1 hypothetical protein HPGCJGGD_1462 [Methylobacterium haplocladii]GLS58596.1 hypothetical protein GCM10007887_12600 [Methylobacterium haplocladii]
MISALIHVARPADPEAIERLADTLSALVAGVAAGLVADAVIVSARACDALETIADASGATLVQSGPAGPWRAAAQMARHDWVLCLEAGDLPREGWIRSVDRFVGTARPEVILARLRRPHAGIGDRLAARIERLLGARNPRAGDLVRRDSLLAGSGFSPRQRPRAMSAGLERT